MVRDNILSRVMSRTVTGTVAVCQCEVLTAKQRRSRIHTKRQQLIHAQSLRTRLETQQPEEQLVRISDQRVHGRRKHRSSICYSEEAPNRRKSSENVQSNLAVAEGLRYSPVLPRRGRSTSSYSANRGGNTKGRLYKGEVGQICGTLLLLGLQSSSSPSIIQFPVIYSSVGS
jgi:hypothetical protein